MSKFLLALSALISTFVHLAGPAIAQTIVQNRDEPGRNKYQAHATISSICSFGNGCVATFPSVTASERVVVEYVSCFITVPTGTSPIAVVLGGQAIDTTNRAYVPAIHQGDISTASTYIVSSPVVFYFVTGDTPIISLLLNGSVGSSPGDCLLTGYHVILP